MSNINATSIERYQELYEKDPTSRVFAPLAEGYRRMGLLKEAVEVCENGVKLHPQFAGGRVALGRIYIDCKRYSEAIKELKEVTELAPDNMLAYNLLAETYLHLKRPKEALKSYKMLLFLAPDNAKAKTAVQKLESLTADEYEDDVFEMRPLTEAVKEWDQLDLEIFKADDNAEKPTSQSQEKQSSEPKKLRDLDRIVSLADAYIVRNDIENALAILQEGERLLGAHPEVVKRLKLIHHRQIDNIPHPKTAADLKSKPNRGQQAMEDRIEFLQDLLTRFKDRAKEF